MALMKRWSVDVISSDPFEGTTLILKEEINEH
jgi:hypothetical protein